MIWQDGAMHFHHGALCVSRVHPGWAIRGAKTVTARVIFLIPVSCLVKESDRSAIQHTECHSWLCYGHHCIDSASDDVIPSLSVIRQHWFRETVVTTLKNKLSKQHGSAHLQLNWRWLAEDDCPLIHRTISMENAADLHNDLVLFLKSARASY